MREITSYLFLSSLIISLLSVCLSLIYIYYSSKNCATDKFDEQIFDKYMKKVKKVFKLSIPFYIIFLLSIVDTLYYEYEMISIYNEGKTLKCNSPQYGKSLFINKRDYSHENLHYFIKRANTKEEIPLQLCRKINSNKRGI